MATAPLRGDSPCFNLATAILTGSMPGLSSRASVEDLIECLIDRLDCMDGDTDLEDGDEDRCAADDDNPAPVAIFEWIYAAGDPDDAEEDNAALY